MQYWEHDHNGLIITIQCTVGLQNKYVVVCALSGLTCAIWEMSQMCLKCDCSIMAYRDIQVVWFGTCTQQTNDDKVDPMKSTCTMMKTRCMIQNGFIIVYCHNGHTVDKQQELCSNSITRFSIFLNRYFLYKDHMIVQLSECPRLLY